MRFKAKLKMLYGQLLRGKYEIINELFGHLDYKKFVIISRSRTGSTLLMALLNDHPNVICEGELFKDLKGNSCKQIWNAFFKKKNKEVKQVGFKLFYYHPFDNDKEVWEFIKKDKEITIIHLVRENKLEAFVSQKIGEKTKKWTENINRPHNIKLEDKRVILNYDECKATFEKINAYEEQTRLNYRGFNYVEISYEGLTLNAEKALIPIYNSLGVDIKKVKTVMKKQNPEKIIELVENYGEIKDKFQGTKWSCYFE